MEYISKIKGHRSTTRSADDHADDDIAHTHDDSNDNCTDAQGDSSDTHSHTSVEDGPDSLANTAGLQQRFNTIFFPGISPSLIPRLVTSDHTTNSQTP